MGSCSYKKWKVLVLSKLIEILNIEQDQDPYLREKIIKLIDKLHYIKLRDLYSVITDLYELSQKIKDLYDLIPKYEQVKLWIEQSKRKKNV
ncbi:MAG: hypothetical protein QXS19_05845 [Candidatus Methanomethylicia archaeon]